MPEYCWQNSGGKRLKSAVHVGSTDPAQIHPAVLSRAARHGCLASNMPSLKVNVSDKRCSSESCTSKRKFNVR